MKSGSGHAPVDTYLSYETREGHSSQLTEIFPVEQGTY